MYPSKIAPLALLISLPLITLSSHADEAPDYTGAELFGVFCASCHGPQARGNGAMAKSLPVKPADLTRIARRHDGEFPTDLITRIIDGRELRPEHRKDDMPVWGQEFYATSRDDAARRARSNELIDRLVEYLRSIQR